MATDKCICEVVETGAGPAGMLDLHPGRRHPFCPEHGMERVIAALRERLATAERDALEGAAEALVAVADHWVYSGGAEAATVGGIRYAAELIKVRALPVEGGPDAD